MNDPEERIAELERGAGLLQAGSSRRFFAFAAPPTTKQMMKYTYVLMFAGPAFLGVLYAALFMVGSLVDSETVWQVGGGVVLCAFMLFARPAFGAFQRRMNREKQVFVDVGSGGLTVHTVPGVVFPFGDAQLGPWTVAGYGAMTKGTALHLRCGEHRFVLGGRDHRLGTGTPLEADPVDTVDAWMRPSEFDELLAVVRPAGLKASAATSDEPTRCLLTPNPARLFSYSFVGMFKNTATALSLNANPPKPSVAIDIANDEISVIDLKSNALIASVAASQVTATPAESTRSLPRVGTQATPVLDVSIPGSQPLTIGCADVTDPRQVSRGLRTKLTYRFSWRGDVRAEPEPEFVVSDTDWLTLVETFGLAPYLDDKGRSAAATDAVVARPTSPRLSRFTRKPWRLVAILAVVMVVVTQAVLWFASSISYSHELKDQQLTASREQRFALPFTDLRLPHGVAVDAAGNVYVTDTHANRVVKLAAGSGTQTVLPFSGLDLSDGGIVDADTAGIAVDAAGDVYVTDSGHNRVLRLAAGSNTQSVLPFRRLSSPRGVAVDAEGTVYVVDFEGRIVKLAAGSTTQTALPSTGGGNLSDVAVDTAGTVYANVFRCSGKSSCSSTLLKLAAGSKAWAALPSAGRAQTAVTVDNADNVYVLTLGDTGSVMRLTSGSNQWTELPGAPRFVDPMGMAVDTQGNVYVTDHTGSREPLALFGIWKMTDDDAHGFVLKLPG